MGVYKSTKINEAEDFEGFDDEKGSWGDYPIDKVLIRNETRTIYDVLRRIKQKQFVMNPDFQRDFIWKKDKQSKLIESVVMRIPLPVFYMAEDEQGKMIVVDGLQRLTTFCNYVEDELRLNLPKRSELNQKKFSELSPKLQNRIEDFNLIFYIINSGAPERARLDIFERVNGGVPLSRQQMRNCLYMGEATKFLKEEAASEVFSQATGGSLKANIHMRDREFINRFCAFQLLDLSSYFDMDEYLADCLVHMNRMGQSLLSQLSDELHRSLRNNYTLFGRHAFRKHEPGQENRSVLNASLWDVMSTSLSRYSNQYVKENKQVLRRAVYELLNDDEFIAAISYGTNGTKQVKTRFQMTERKFEEVLSADAN